jgi:hypothetical protein
MQHSISIVGDRAMELNKQSSQVPIDAVLTSEQIICGTQLYKRYVTTTHVFLLILAPRTYGFDSMSPIVFALCSLTNGFAQGPNIASHTCQAVSNYYQPNPNIYNESANIIRQHKHGARRRLATRRQLTTDDLSLFTRSYTRLHNRLPVCALHGTLSLQGSLPRLA